MQVYANAAKYGKQTLKIKLRSVEVLRCNISNFVKKQPAKINSNPFNLILSRSMHNHYYKATISWTGNSGKGTSDYKAYERSHTINIINKPIIPGSSDPNFCGDKTKHNPEELLLASLSACHMLWYLSLCAGAGVIVTDYKDDATGTMTEMTDGSGNFTEVTLNPIVTVSEPSMVDKANELHVKANKMCFIANSVNFPVHHKPSCNVRAL